MTGVSSTIHPSKRSTPIFVIVIGRKALGLLQKIRLIILLLKRKLLSEIFLIHGLKLHILAQLIEAEARILVVVCAILQVRQRRGSDL